MDICMPKFEETSESAVLVKWLKQPGERVVAGEAIAEVETEKFSHPLEAPAAGTLQEHRVDEGSDIPVGAVLAVLAPDA
jgi:pyruvate dehydrogenase E2 component (dihydrolipoamide acetyltransferase)